MQNAKGFFVMKISNFNQLDKVGCVDFMFGRHELACSSCGQDISRVGTYEVLGDRSIVCGGCYNWLVNELETFGLSPAQAGRLMISHPDLSGLF